jgi:hypothetical protein
MPRWMQYLATIWQWIGQADLGYGSRNAIE